MAYNTIGPGVAAAPAVIPEMGPLMLPLGMAFALWHDYTYPDQTAYRKGLEKAERERTTRLYREERERAAQDRAQAIADNKALEQFYAREIAKGNGAWVIEGKNYRKTITGYNPHNGTFTARVDYPNTGSYMEGTFPEVNYRPLEDGRNFDELTNAEIVYQTGPHAGRWTAKPGYFDFQTQQYEPDMLIESYLQPIAQKLPESFFTIPDPKQLPLQLSTGRVVALPSDITDYRVFDESVDPGAGELERDGAKTGAGVKGGSPRRNDDDDDDDDNQISSVEEYIRRFGKDINRRTARRLRKSERISHDANGNINHRATRLLNRGAKGGSQGAKSPGFNWKDFAWGISTGVGGTLGAQAIFGNKGDEKDPELHGDKTYVQRADSLINRAMQGVGSSEQTETPPIQGDSIDWDKIKF